MPTAHSKCLQEAPSQLCLAQWTPAGSWTGGKEPQLMALQSCALREGEQKQSGTDRSQRDTVEQADRELMRKGQALSRPWVSTGRQ